MRVWPRRGRDADVAEAGEMFRREARGRGIIYADRIDELARVVAVDPYDGDLHPGEHLHGEHADGRGHDEDAVDALGPEWPAARMTA